MNAETYIRRIKEVSALLGIIACMWLLLHIGIPLQMEQDAIKNAKHWEARK